MQTKIRKTKKSEYLITENITREAFWNLFTPGCSEHLVLHQLRKSDCYIDALDVVAETEGVLSGHSLTTKASIVDKNGIPTEVLCVGPISVLPHFQHRGIGSALMKQSIKIGQKLGYRGMLLFGDPDYYSRFGFIDAKHFGISTKEGQNFAPFMALALYHNGLSNVHGRFFESDAFAFDENELELFDKGFGKKEKGKPRIILNF